VEQTTSTMCVCSAALLTITTAHHVQGLHDLLVSGALNYIVIHLSSCWVCQHRNCTSQLLTFVVMLTVVAQCDMLQT
jgi:hypothetical protein